MYILGIDTTSEQLSIALYDLEKKQVVDYKKVEKLREQLKFLIPEIDLMLKRNKVSKSDLKYIASSIGPGSFTGIRIGVSTSRALCQCLGILALPSPTLNTFLMKESVKPNLEKGNLISAIINARRNQVYGFVYGKDGFLLPPGPYMIDDVLNVIKENGNKAIFYGDGVDSYNELIKDYDCIDKEDRYQNAKDLVLYSLNVEPVTYDKLHPEYMRLAEAEQKLMNGELKISHMRQE